MTIEFNKWYRMIGGTTGSRREVVRLFGEMGYKAAVDFTKEVPPECFCLNPDPKRLLYRTKYNPDYIVAPMEDVHVDTLIRGIKELQCISERKCEGECAKENRSMNNILEASFRTELEMLEENTMDAIHNLFMDNVYIKGIKTAIDKANKETGYKYTLENCDFRAEMFLTEKECKKRDEIFNKRRVAEDKLRQKYMVAESLLNMADTYDQKHVILTQYTKGVMNKIVDLSLKD